MVYEAEQAIEGEEQCLQQCGDRCDEHDQERMLSTEVEGRVVVGLGSTEVVGRVVGLGWESTEWMW